MIGDTYVIGLCGQAQAGKDTTARSLIELYSLIDIKRYALADYLKKMYREAQIAWCIDGEPARFVQTLPLNDTQRHGTMIFLSGLFLADRAKAISLYTEEDKAFHRPNLIALGLFMRELDPDFWVKYTRNEIEKENHQFAIITDIRFQNETTLCDVLVRVVRPGRTVIYSEGKVDPSEIFSITGHYDYLFDNQYNMETEEGRAEIENQLYRMFDAVRDKRSEEMRWKSYKPEWSYK